MKSDSHGTCSHVVSGDRGGALQRVPRADKAGQERTSQAVSRDLQLLRTLEDLSGWGAGGVIAALVTLSCLVYISPIPWPTVLIPKAQHTLVEYTTTTHTNMLHPPPYVYSTHFL